ncbi:MAG: type III pantothenate kinase [Steroidobacteraceae bacterium]
MTTLLVDLGNTRIKWAKLGAAGPGRMRTAEHRGWTRADFERALFGGRRSALRRGAAAVDVIAVSVAAAAVQRRFVAAVRAVTGRPPRLCGSQRVACGVRNGYADVWRLGADRWIALLGARQTAPRRAVCVVDVGTATTIDLLAADGRHRGGAILPGPQLMIATLLRDTGGIRRRARGRTATRDVFARDTGAALHAGALLATVGAIEQAWLAACRRTIGTRPVLLLTGGASGDVARRLRPAHQRVPDLVLRGLAALARRAPGA